MDVTIKYNGKWVKANVTFTEMLTVGNNIVDFNENKITNYIKMTHIGECNFRGNMFSTYVPNEAYYMHELIILFGRINHLYSKK